MATLFSNAVIITVDDQRRIYRDGAILVVGNRIEKIGDSRVIGNPDNLPQDLERIDLKGKIVMPGLINGHIHLIQSLMRGLAEGMNLHDWASCAIWPMEVAYQRDDGYTAARLSMAEMIKTGTTCFLEPMLPASAGFDRVADAVRETGIRACLVCNFSRPNFVKSMADDTVG
jgi:cytosine/adenosine deaminase-related metal-dependent hydrolase